MAELWPPREPARPRNVPDWMLDRLDEYTSMPSGMAYAKKPYDEVLDEARLSELRRQQASLQDEKRRLDGTRQNRVLAGGALAAPALLLGSEFAGGFGFRAARTVPKFRPLDLLDREVLPTAPKIASFEHPNIAKSPEVLRANACEIWARKNGLSGAEREEMKLHVHHEWPIQYNHLLRGADPSRFSNLTGLKPAAHEIANRECVLSLSWWVKTLPPRR